MAAASMWIIYRDELKQWGHEPNSGIDITGAYWVYIKNDRIKWYLFTEDSYRIFLTQVSQVLEL